MNLGSPLFDPIRIPPRLTPEAIAMAICAEDGVDLELARTADLQPRSSETRKIRNTRVRIAKRMRSSGWPDTESRVVPVGLGKRPGRCADHRLSADREGRSMSLEHDPAQEARISLPWPPSTNGLFVNVPRKGRVPSGEYARWRQDAGWLLKSQRPPKFAGRVDIVVELCSPHSVPYDPDNRLKAPIDLIRTYGVIVDDSNKYIRSAMAVVVHDAAPCTVVVRAAA